MSVRFLIGISIALSFPVTHLTAQQNVDLNELLSGAISIVGESGLRIGEVGAGVVESVTRNRDVTRIKIKVTASVPSRSFEVQRDEKYDDFVRVAGNKGKSFLSLEGQAVTFTESLDCVGFPREFVQSGCDIAPGPFFQIRSSILLMPLQVLNAPLKITPRSGKMITISEFAMRKSTIVGDLGVPLGEVCTVQIRFDSGGAVVSRNGERDVRYKFDELQFVNCASQLKRSDFVLDSIRTTICYEKTENQKVEKIDANLDSTDVLMKRILVIKVPDSSLSP